MMTHQDNAELKAAFSRFGWDSDDASTTPEGNARRVAVLIRGGVMTIDEATDLILLFHRNEISAATIQALEDQTSDAETAGRVIEKHYTDALKRHWRALLRKRGAA